MAASDFTTSARPAFVTPAQARVAPGAVRQFTAGGGTGPYTFDLAENNTGGSIAAGGLWSAGTLPGTDKIRATDSVGAEAFADGNCLDGPTLLDLRTQARQRADTVNDGNIEDSELTSYANASAAELYDLLVASYEDTYFQAPPYAVVTDGTHDSYPYPPDLYKLRGLDLQVGPGPRGFLTLRRTTFKSRNDHGATLGSLSAYGVGSYGYTDMGERFRLMPLPPAGLTIRVWYVPRLAKLVGEDDVLDGVGGWEEYVVVDCAIKMLLKQESDASGFILQKQALKQRITQMAAHRDLGSPPVAGDTCYDEYYGYAPGYGRTGY